MEPPRYLILAGLYMGRLGRNAGPVECLHIVIPFFPRFITPSKLLMCALLCDVLTAIVSFMSYTVYFFESILLSVCESGIVREMRSETSVSTRDPETGSLMTSESV